MYTRLEKLLSDENGILITSPYNMQYFSGFSGGEGAVFVTRGARLIFTDSRYTEQAQKEAEQFEVIETNNARDCVCKRIKADGVRDVLYEDRYLTAAEYIALSGELDKTALLPCSAELAKMRMIKTPAELEKLKKAEEIACRAFRGVLSVIKPGISENDIAAELEYLMRRGGGGGVSFETIAISGKKTSLPHGKPDGRQVEYGDFVTMDFGCTVDGYCSDMTRTVVVGKANAEQRKIYDTVRRAQQAGLDFLRSGVSAKAADNAARSVIESAGYGKYFGHSLGHGVGLQIHELPNLSPRAELMLEENMTVTCEPGIYIPDFGGVRIEDMVCIKGNSAENFTYETKELLEL